MGKCRKRQELKRGNLRIKKKKKTVCGRIVNRMWLVLKGEKKKG